LSLLAFVILIVFTFHSSGKTLQVKRDACEQLQTDVDTCRSEAYKEYSSAMLAGHDGRPDWVARKTCNYLKAAIEDCYANLVGDCLTEEEANKRRDEEIPPTLEQLSEIVSEWDSEKCPVVKNHLDRVQMDECEQLQEELQKEVDVCRSNAYDEYQRAMVAGDDGRPDWVARKNCNYLNQAIEECYEKLIGDCHTEYEVNTIRDAMIPDILEKIEETVEEWDSERCPVFRKHLDRVAPLPPTGKSREDDPATVESAAHKEEETQSNEDSENLSETMGDEDPVENSSSQLSINEPESGSEAPALSLFLMFVLYMMF